jgi:hypothetical protein
MTKISTPEPANDNTRAHVAPVMAKARAGRLFPSEFENLLAVNTINRMDGVFAAAESDPCYSRAEEGQFARSDEDGPGDYIGRSPSVEVEGRSAEKLIEDFHNGPTAWHSEITPSRHGRFKFNTTGIIIGYRLNRIHNGDETRNYWVKPSSPKHPDNKVTPRYTARRDHRSEAPGKTNAHHIIVPANDNFDARTCVTWLKARMAPEHFEAVYDVTAGHGFLEIGRSGGFSGKQAEAVGRDRVVSGLRQCARLLAEWDDVDEVHPKRAAGI